MRLTSTFFWCAASSNSCKLSVFFLMLPQTLAKTTTRKKKREYSHTRQQQQKKKRSEESTKVWVFSCAFLPFFPFSLTLASFTPSNTNKSICSLSLYRTKLDRKRIQRQRGGFPSPNSVFLVSSSYYPLLFS